MRYGVGAAAGALAALVTVAGCGGGGTEELLCTKVAAESGVGVQVTDPEPGVVYRMCVGPVCDEGRKGDRGSAPGGVSVWVHLPDSAGAPQVSVRFTATPDGSTRATVDERATVRLKKFQPNGPHCPPFAYRGALTYSRDQGLATWTPTAPER